MMLSRSPVSLLASRRFGPFGLLLVLVLSIGLPGAAPAASSGGKPASFLSNLEDVPLMAGLVERKDLAISFDKPEGRIVEAYAEGRLAQAEVAKFYAATLPQLGWKGQGNNRFAREGEELHLGFSTRANVLTVHFSLSPRR